jgi:hypothetical protein
MVSVVPWEACNYCFDTIVFIDGEYDFPRLFFATIPMGDLSENDLYFAMAWAYHPGLLWIC